MEPEYKSVPLKYRESRKLGPDSIVGMVLYVVILGILLYYIISTLRGKKGE
jgi:hypothetical protein